MKHQTARFFVFSTVSYAIALLFSACQPALHQAPHLVDNQRLNTLLTLEVGRNEVFVQDFILQPEHVDSLTCHSKWVNVDWKKGDEVAILTLQSEAENFLDLQIHSRNVAYSVPCRKSDKVSYLFTFDPQGKKYEEVRIAGQMNDWTPSRTPALEKNEQGLYELMLYLSPGTYLYQMLLDGEQNHDSNNPEKVDNGFGKYNSILYIQGHNEHFPILTTDRLSKNKISLTVENECSELFIYWQNYRLPDKFIKIADGKITFDIPYEATSVARSYCRVWAVNEYGVSNEILVPLHKGQVLTRADELERTDRHAQIMYFMLVDRFMNGDTLNDQPMNRPDVNQRVDYWGGDLAGLQQKIETGYFDSLGVNTLWVSPLSENPREPYGYYAPKKTKFSGYHGYWPVSSSKVDFRFGTNDELKSMVAQAHQHQINVLLDYVSNHIHESHPLYQQHPEFATDLYLPDGTMNVEKWDEQRLTTWFDTFLPTLNYANPEVVDLMTDSALYWLREFDLDGFRHDACKHVNLEFWRLLTLKMKKNLPDKMNYQIGETYGSPSLIASYLTTGMLDGQFDFNVYDIANTTFAGVSGGDFKRVQQVLQASHYIYGAHNLMGYISGNHDKARFMAYASGDVRFGEDAKAAGWNREIAITDSLAYDRLLLFHAFNLSIPGIPVIYYGDEIGLTGGNDPDSRRMMRFDHLNPREQKLKNEFSRLAKLRRSQPVLIYGDFINIDTQTDTWAYARKYFDREAIILLNNSRQAKKLELELPKALQAEQFQAFNHNDFSISHGKLSLTLPPYSVEILY